jgi:tetratricopeptide (TPR) repeat protein
MMKMKKLFISILVVVLATGCEDYLTIEPTNQLLTSESINTADDIQRTLVSAYDVMRNSNYFGGNMWTMSDLISDNTEKDFSDFGWDQVAQRSMNLFNIQGRDFWKNAYISAERANYVMYLLENSGVPDLSEAEKQRMEGECRFIRAVAHFELVRFYALPYEEGKENDQPGVPLRFKPVIDIAAATEIVPRSPVSEVYDTVIVELKKAVDLLPDENGTYANAWAAKAYLAKVYFQMNDFNQAYAYADDVIENGGFALNDSVADRFAVRNSPEAIFELQSLSAGNNSAGALVGNYRQNGSGNPGFFPSLDLVNQALSDENDLRGKKFYNTRFISGTSGLERTYCAKYDYDYMNVPVLHLSEIILIRAESAIDKATPDLGQAIQDLQTIRDRAYGEGNKIVPTNSTAEDLRLICRFERRLELAMEGNRMHDLKRTKSNVRGLPYNSDKLVWQIPDDEQAGNPDIEMN